MENTKTLTTEISEKKTTKTKQAFIPNKGYESLYEALNDLQKRGYTYDFNFDNDCLFCIENKTKLKPEDFEIVEYYRFEGSSDPSDNSIIYAIESEKYNIKGVLVNAYGIYSENASDALLSKFKIAY